MPQNKITNEMIQACYLIGKDLVSGKILRADVDHRLEKIGIGNASGWDYVNNYKNLLNGRQFARTMNLYGTKYYLDKIHEDEGKVGLQNALRSLMAHIQYYEGLNPTKTNCRGKRAIHSEFLKML